jgi:hypothetical protein
MVLTVRVRSRRPDVNKETLMNISLTGTRRPAARAAACIVCLVTLSSVAAACGSTAKQGDGVASIGTDKPATNDNSTDGTTDGTTDTSTPDSVDPQDAFVEYSKCMRDNGIDMPDPQVAQANGQGGATAGAPMIVTATVPEGEEGDPSFDGPSFDPNSQEFKDANKECQPILDDATTAISIDPEVAAEHREQMLDYAKCMRDHGIDFPDPTFDDGGGISISVNGGEDEGTGPRPDDGAFQDANKACASEVFGNDGGPIIGAAPAVTGS